MTLVPMATTRNALFLELLNSEGIAIPIPI